MSYVPSVIRLLFLVKVGTAFDNKIFWAWLFGESPNSKVLTFSENYGGAENLRELSSVRYISGNSRGKWEASSLVNPQTHLESVIILD